MARKQEEEPSVPEAAKPAYDAIVGLTDRFCQAELTWEYQMLCRKLAAALARKRPSPLTRGKPEVWACAVVRVIGWVNFLDDDSTGQGKAKAIRDLLKIRQFDFRWMLRQRIETTSMVWMISVNGFVVDGRRLKREIQEEALKKRLIPYIPGEKPTVQKSTDGEEGLHP